MSDPYIRPVGEVFDMDNHCIQVGVNYDTVTIDDFCLTSSQIRELLSHLAAACWEAGENKRRMDGVTAR